MFDPGKMAENAFSISRNGYVFYCCGNDAPKLCPGDSTGPGRAKNHAKWIAIRQPGHSGGNQGGRRRCHGSSPSASAIAMGSFYGFVPPRRFLPVFFRFFGWIVLLAAGSFSGSVRGDNWPSFRGPLFNGSSSESKLPVWISKQAYVKWKTDLPGPGSSTPAVWNDAVFLTAIDSEENGICAVKLNLYSGKIEWSHLFAEGIRQDRRADFASPSPATDGKVAVFVSGNGAVSAFDYRGNSLWKRNLCEDYGDFSLKWTYSSSPVIFEDLLYIQILQRNESIDGVNPGRSSYLLAFDPATGAEKWRFLRRSRAVREAQEAYSSPVPMEYEGRKEILVAGADCLTGHDPATGKEFWRWGTWNRLRDPYWRIVTSPVHGDEVVAACAPKGEPVYSVLAGATKTLRINDYKWRTEKHEVSCDIPSPLFYRGHFYFLNGRKKVLSCVTAYTGEVMWSQSFGARAKIEASPTASDGKIFVISHTGEVFIFQAATKYRLLHSTVLGEDTEAKYRSSIVPARGRLLIRLGDTLWCMD